MVMCMKGFTFLTTDQIYGDSQLDIIKNMGASCEITDFSILNGGSVIESYTAAEGKTRNGSGSWWTRTKCGRRTVYDAFYKTTGPSISEINGRTTGARPALPYSSISGISSNGVRNSLGIIEVEYGEYPQMVVDEYQSRELEKKFKGGYLKPSGKKYTNDRECWDDYDEGFWPYEYIEYIYNGKKYIRIVAGHNGFGYQGAEKRLSDGRIIKRGEPYWIEVEPIKWLVDERADIALSKRIIFAGIQFDRRKKYRGNFRRTGIKQFMDKYFSKEIVSDRVYTEETQTNDQQNNETLSSLNNGSFESQNESNENNGARHDIHSTSDEEVERDSASKELNAMIKEKLEAEERIREDKKSMLHKLKEYLARKNAQSSEQEASHNINGKSK